MKLEKKTTYVLRMDHADALWLRGVMQNPLNGLHPEEEDEQDRQHRYEFFEQLKNVPHI